MTPTRRVFSPRLILWMSLCVWCAVVLGGSIGVGQPVQLGLPSSSHVLRNSSFQLPGLRSISDPSSSLSPFLTGNISNHMAFDLLVAPMPQAGSSKIVFASDRDGSMQIYLMNPDGSAQTRLTYSGANDDYPRWSPNGTKILFQSDRDHPDTGYMDVYVMNSDGSGGTRLTSDANDDGMAMWAPGGTKIVFQSMRNGVNYQIYLMDADGSNQVNLTNTSSSDGEPSCSPDGSKIVFASDRDHAGFDSVYVMNSDGTNQQRITFGSGNVEDMQPIWSQDGSRIAFVSTRDSTVETWQETDDDDNVINKTRLNINKEVYVMNADGSGQTRLTNELGNDDSPSWSPDGSKIIFRSDRERDGSDPSSQVWAMNSDGTGQTDLSPTNDGDYSANWVLGWMVGDGAADVSPDATANSVTINFDTQPQGSVIFNQYQSAIFSATGFSSPPGGCGSVVMGVMRLCIIGRS